ncbi:helicase-associated domain-containing protein [Pseudarthrobacter sp. PS3-L1]|uniref:helicase-associated domain-containing protein n=1 Tax=Pseudarthrobacter sp. PS3-L1 TaxID=3046207 RepID=UPI0024B8E0E8|nr:helicase-associated domain-containing protein [Pseudarthrobacter sp. PS3-L1]MDJ0319378.1 helicase-associated domain-containing protein [Pseudarthrobacter sp. PS3-L1]
MSMIQALGQELSARSDDSLRELFAARPDLMAPAAHDFSTLAARASARVSVQRALERLSRPEMQVLETLHLCTNTDTGHSASVAGLRKLISGSTLVALEPLLANLQALALIHRAEPPHGTVAGRQKFYLPVASLKDVLGIYPAGLGRSYTELVRLQPSFAQHAVDLVSELRSAGQDLHAATTPMEAALALQQWTASPAALQRILADAPDRTPALLAKFGHWAMGAVPKAQRKTSLAQSSPAGPVDWLLARGLLVPLDASHVELPHSVGLALRGGAIITDFSLHPPRPQLGTTSAMLRRNAALGSVAETLRLIGELLGSIQRHPLTTLRSGGVGVRELKRLADSLRLDTAKTAVLAEIAALAGLLRLDVDSSSWIQPPDLEWLALPRQEQWLWLVTAWLTSERVPSLVGQPVAGHVTADVSRATGGQVNVLSAEAQRPDAPLVRRRILEVLLELSTEADPGDGTAPVVDAAAVMERAEWSQPRMSRRFSSLIRGVLAEAELLGLVGSGALSQLGSAVATDRHQDALALLGNHLPAEVEHVLLQADLTAIAPGYLAPRIAATLLLMSDAEGQGPATTFRFSATTIRRALDSGLDATAILGFLQENSATAVPQPLEYLIADTASRHGQVKVGPAASFIQSSDEGALERILAAAPAAGIHVVQLAPTVLVSTTAPREVARALRDMGVSPAVDDAQPALLRVRRSIAAPGSVRPVYSPPGAPPPDGEITAQIALLRGEAATVHGGPGQPSLDSASEAAPHLGLESLAQAIRLGRAVIMNVVDSAGNESSERVVPLSAGGGRVRVHDPARDTERVISVHRIIDVQATEEHDL